MRTPIALLSVLTLALVGCGSTPETRQGFVARADAICEATLRDVRNVSPPAASGSVSLPALARYLGAVTPRVESELKQLRSLPRPPMDRGAIARYLAALDGVASNYKALGAAATAGDRQAVSQALAALQASPAAALAGRYGLTACAGSTGTVSPSG
jgi:hypothetical protein